MIRLPNRAAFRAELEARLESNRTPLAVLQLDIDDFKLINDRAGYAAGDQVLGEVAERLCGFLGVHDSAYHLGGDEFALLFPQLLGQETLTAVAQGLNMVLRPSFAVHDPPLTLTCSIGVILAHPGECVRDVLWRADMALYQAKTEGKNQIAHYDPLFLKERVERHDLAQDLALALEHQNVSVAYQPIVELSSGKIVALEALARWCDPLRGVVSPNLFIPVAEEEGLIEELSQVIFFQAMEQICPWLADAPHLLLHLNVSAGLLCCVGLPHTIASLLEQTGFPVQNLVLEVTETAVLASSALLSANLQGLRALGVTISVDDFGLGYCSLGHLLALSPASLKIDRSFIETLGADTRLVEGILRLSESLQIESIAEGVETEAQREQLLAMGWRYGQGYLFARPTTAPQLGTLLA